ncbi:flavin reductase family protein, partial [Streptomyces albidoflavus]
MASSAGRAIDSPAFVSVSLDPPLVMVSVRTGSRMDDVLT